MPVAAVVCARPARGVARHAPFELRRLLTHWHPPQGAPTSPALATLAAYDCVKHGLDSQARGAPHFRQHLEGRVAWVEQLSPKRGARLRALLSKL